MTPEKIREVESNLPVPSAIAPLLTRELRKPQEHAIYMIDLVIEPRGGISVLDTLRERCKDGCPFCTFTQLNEVEPALGKVKLALAAVHVARGRMSQAKASEEAERRVKPIREGMSIGKIGECKENQAILTAITSIEGDLKEARDMFTRNLAGGRGRKRRTRRRGIKQRRTRRRRTRGRTRHKRNRHATRRRRKLKCVF